MAKVSQLPNADMFLAQHFSKKLISVFATFIFFFVFATIFCYIQIFESDFFFFFDFSLQEDIPVLHGSSGGETGNENLVHKMTQLEKKLNEIKENVEEFDVSIIF